MEQWWGPKRSSEDTPSVESLQHEWGRGEYDEETGLYEWYEVEDEELAEHDGRQKTVSYTKIIENWRILEGAFQAVLNIDLEELFHRKSWRWFSTRVAYLLADNNPFSRAVFPPPDPSSKELADHM